MAQYYARYYPTRINKLILSHTLKPDFKYAWHLNIKSKIIKTIPNFIYQRKFKKRIKISSSDFWMAYRQYYFYSIFKLYSKNELANTYKAWSQNIKKEPVDKNIYKGSTVILSSKDDTDVAIFQEELQNLYPQSEIYEFDKGGHHTALTYPEEYTNVLRNCVAKH